MKNTAALVSLNASVSHRGGRWCQRPSCDRCWSCDFLLCVLATVERRRVPRPQGWRYFSSVPIGTSDSGIHNGRVLTSLTHLACSNDGKISHSLLVS